MSPIWSNKEEERRDPLSQVVMKTPMPIGLEKPLPLGTYDDTTNLDEHIENIDALLIY